MVEGSALEIFALIASVCAVVLTLACIVVVYYVVSAVTELRALLRTAQREAERVTFARDSLVRRLRVIVRSAEIFARRTLDHGARNPSQSPL